MIFESIGDVIMMICNCLYVFFGLYCKYMVVVLYYVENIVSVGS